MKKFKFLKLDSYSVEWYYEDVLNDYKKVENPIGDYKELKDGTYMIRGKRKGERWNYWRLKGEWFLTSHVSIDNGHYLCDATTYELFPNLSQKECEHFNNIPFKSLNKYWKRALRGYTFWMELREIGRNAMKVSLKYKL